MLRKILRTGSLLVSGPHSPHLIGNLTIQVLDLLPARFLDAFVWDLEA